MQDRFQLVLSMSVYGDYMYTSGVDKNKRFSLKEVIVTFETRVPLIV